MVLSLGVFADRLKLKMAKRDRCSLEIDLNITCRVYYNQMMGWRNAFEMQLVSIGRRQALGSICWFRQLDYRLGVRYWSDELWDTWLLAESPRE